MAKRTPAAVVKDFNDVWEYLKSQGTAPSTATAEVISEAKGLHWATYSLILWRFRLKGLPEWGRVFVEEIASDALQILPQALMGYGKTTDLLIRGVAENALRHIYFSDHPVEFDRMNREHKWYISFDELVKYAHLYPAISAAEKKFDAVNKLVTLYSELSACVHGRRVQDLEMRLALNQITFNPNSFKRHVKLTERCAEAVNFLLATFRKAHVDGFQTEDRQIILYTMRPEARKVLSGLA